MDSAGLKLHKLVYYEYQKRIEDAIARGKHRKSKTRVKKVAIINSQNPNWHHLARISHDITEAGPDWPSSDDVMKNPGQR